MLIGITGLKRSGKDTVAFFLSSKFGMIHFAFADTIREVLKAIFLWTDDTFTYYKEDIDPLWGVSPRQMMQHLGTDWGQLSLSKDFPDFNKIIGRDIWVNNLWYKIRKTDPKLEKDYCISDVRFPHEAKFIHDHAGIIIKVRRPACEEKDSHESEKYINDPVNNTSPDYEIINDSTLKALELKVESLMNSILREKKNV